MIPPVDSMAKIQDDLKLRWAKQVSGRPWERGRPARLSAIQDPSVSGPGLVEYGTIKAGGTPALPGVYFRAVPNSTRITVVSLNVAFTHNTFPSHAYSAGDSGRSPKWTVVSVGGAFNSSKTGLTVRPPLAVCCRGRHANSAK